MGRDLDSADAKRFLISRVIAEAELEHVPLLDVEKKMLAFSESDPSFTEDIKEINGDFERQCDTDEYEDKVIQLLKNARDRDAKSSPDGDQPWADALQTLSKEDHYILVMAASFFHGEAGGVQGMTMVPDYMIYVVIGIVIALIVFAVVKVFMWHAYG